MKSRSSKNDINLGIATEKKPREENGNREPQPKEPQQKEVGNPNKEKPTPSTAVADNKKGKGMQPAAIKDLLNSKGVQEYDENRNELTLKVKTLK